MKFSFLFISIIFLASFIFTSCSDISEEECVDMEFIITKTIRDQSICKENEACVILDVESCTACGKALNEFADIKGIKNKIKNYEKKCLPEDSCPSGCIEPRTEAACVMGICEPIIPKISP